MPGRLISSSERTDSQIGHRCHCNKAKQADKLGRSKYPSRHTGRTVAAELKSSSRGDFKFLDIAQFQHTAIRSPCTGEYSLSPSMTHRTRGSRSLATIWSRCVSRRGQAFRTPPAVIELDRDAIRIARTVRPTSPFDATLNLARPKHVSSDRRGRAGCSLAAWWVKGWLRNLCCRLGQRGLNGTWTARSATRPQRPQDPRSPRRSLKWNGRCLGQ